MVYSIYIHTHFIRFMKKLIPRILTSPYVDKNENARWGCKDDVNEMLKEVDKRIFVTLPNAG